MNINAIVVALLITIIGLYSWKAFSMGDKIPSQLPWVPIDVNKPRSFVNQTRDAGMFTERTRRVAIISNPQPFYGFKGSTNGSLESNFLTSICVCPSKGPICPTDGYVIDDGGNATSDVCDYIDGNGNDPLDGGGAGPNACDTGGCQSLEIDDGGDATAENCDYIDGNGNDIIDGGKADVNLCDL
jgi:hypothetical protein